MARQPDNARALAAAAVVAVEEALLDLVASGWGRIEVEVESAARGRRRVLVTAGKTTCVTLAAEDLGSEVLRRTGLARDAKRQADNGGSGDEGGAPGEERRYLTTDEVGARYRVTAGAVLKRLRRGQLPAPVRVGRRRLWDPRDLDRFDDRHK